MADEKKYDKLPSWQSLKSAPLTAGYLAVYDSFSIWYYDLCEYDLVVPIHTQCAVTL